MFVQDGSALKSYKTPERKECPSGGNPPYSPFPKFPISLNRCRNPPSYFHVTYLTPGTVSASSPRPPSAYPDAVDYDEPTAGHLRCFQRDDQGRGAINLLEDTPI